MDDKKVIVNNSGLTRAQVDYPSNAHKMREEKTEEKKVLRVVTGRVKIQKKSFAKRILETFVGDSMGNVANYVLHDVLIPAAKSTLYDMVKGSFSMALFGEKQGSRTTRDNGRSYVSYNSVSSNRDGTRDRNDRQRQNEPRNRSRHNFDNIVLGTRGEAEDVLSHLVDLVIDYTQATVADLYDLIGVTGQFTDNKYGWVDLRSASISRSRDGYLLNLPKPILLD